MRAARRGPGAVERGWGPPGNQGPPAAAALAVSAGLAKPPPMAPRQETEHQHPLLRQHRFALALALWTGAALLGVAAMMLD